jgi:ribonuclease P protein component
MERICKSSQFLYVRHHGIVVKTSPFWLQFCKNCDRTNKIGIIATKRIGNAVYRNRAKRIIRELFRTHKTIFPEFVDIVVIPRKSIFTIAYQDLVNAFRDAIVKASNRL